MPEITPLALEIWMERAKAAEARIAVLEKALTEIAREQSATTATDAADKFQELARSALAYHGTQEGKT